MCKMLKHAQNIDAMVKIQKCSYILCSKVEMFMHVAIQILQSYTELRITAGRQKISD